MRKAAAITMQDRLPRLQRYNGRNTRQRLGEINHQSRDVTQVLASGGPRPSACFGRDAIAARFAHGVFEIAQLWMTAATVVHQKPDQSRMVSTSA